MKTHIMIDCETMGIESNAAIIAIGATAFNANGIIDTFYQVVDLQSSVDIGLTISPSTVMWWLKQSQAAQQAVLRSGCDIEDALTMLGKFITRYTVEAVWVNGPDAVWLDSAYKALNKPNKATPWHYAQVRDFRTIKHVFPTITIPDAEVAHHALHDAIWQTNYLLALHADSRDIELFNGILS